MDSPSLYHVNAFIEDSTKPFTGNPAAVCLLDGSATEDWLQLLARDMNLSETAYLRREGPRFGLRWFTPVTEVDLCGHATLAASHVLFTDRFVCMEEPISFKTRSGELSARALADGRIELDFPTTPARETPSPAGLAEALGVTPTFVGKTSFDYFVTIDDEETLRSLEPDFRALNTVEARGIIVSSVSRDQGVDFVSRFFAPRCGVNEDPATGSAHCALAPFWGEKLGKTEMRARQLSRRGATFDVRWSGDRTFLAGLCSIVARGEVCC